MPAYSTYAIAGLGGYGSFVLKHLLDAGVKPAAIRVLSRSTSSKEAESAGVAVKEVNYDDESTLTTALKGTDVVISTVGSFALGVQPALVDAAAKAGVKLFVPAEFGNDTLGLTEGFLTVKSDRHAQLKKLGIPYVLVFNGPFSDTSFFDYLGFTWADKKVTIIGKGDTPVSWTTRSDSALFLVKALTSWPKEKLNNAVLRVEGDRQTFRDIVKIYEETHPSAGKIAIENTPIEEVEAFIAANPGGASALQWLRLSWEKGAGQVGEPSNSEFPDWKPTTTRDLLAKL